MSVGKHTPGPWNLGSESGPHCVWSSDPSAPVAWATTYPDGGPLPHGEYGDFQLANARLIAAAPELLEALRTLGDFCDEATRRGPSRNECEEMRDVARAAIAKAKGEDS